MSIEPSEEVERHSLKVDLTSMGKEEWGRYIGELLDGMHRVYNAIMDHQEDVPEEVLEAAEAYAAAVCMET